MRGRILIGVVGALVLASAGTAGGQEAWDFHRLDDLSFWDEASLKREGDLVTYQELRVIKDFHAYPSGSMRVDHIALLTTLRASCSARTVVAVSGIAVYDAKGKLTQPAGPVGKARPAPMRAGDPMGPVLDRACSDDTSALPAGLTSIRAAIAEVAKRED